MRRLWVVLTSILVAQALYAQENNFCMDCIQRQIRHDDPNHIWYESDGFCCDLPCAGYENYELKQADRGFGCLTQEVNNELLAGDICASNDNDLGCPNRGGNGDRPGAGGWTSDPIIIDLGDQSYRLTSVSDGVTFDARNEGHAIRTAWTRVGVENAFLARDRNANGRIDTGAELFGNYTPLRSGVLAQNGYEALAELDDNHDGVVNNGDGAWTTLLFWTDRNHDGTSSADELQPVSESSVIGLETERHLIGRKDQWGNEFRYMAHLRVQHAHAESRKSFYDVFLNAAP